MVVERRTATEFEALRPEDVEAGMSWKVIDPPPHEIATKYRSNQLLVNVQHDDKKRTWFLNNTSVNLMIDKHGTDEKEWVGKLLTLMVKTEQFETDGGKETRKVIYLQ